jgi:hypothetical protein
MLKPASTWDESYVLGLPVGESDLFERKGSRLLDLTVTGVDENRVRSELAKQLSAFANTGGGRIVYGVADDGAVDQGGVSQAIKGPTKAWLEDVIPTCTEFEIVGTNVYEILPTAGSTIGPGKGLYVVDVPDSERAPHQSRHDNVYYIRLGGKSRPASHRIIEDVRNRIRHPRMEIGETKLESLYLPRENLPAISGLMTCMLRFHIKNVGALRSSNNCVRVETDHEWCGFPNYEDRTVRKRPTEKLSVVFWEFLDPIYPQMSISFWFQLHVPVRFWPPSTSNIEAVWTFLKAQADPKDLRLTFSLFSDNAPIKSKSCSLADLDIEKSMYEALERDPAWAGIRKCYGL